MLANSLLDIAEDLEERKRFALANQIARAAISVSNNIAEGSGAFSSREFARFISIARSSLFECATLVLLLTERRLLSDADSAVLLERMDHLSRRLTKFRRALLSNRGKD